MESWTDLFIRRPVVAIVVNLIIIIAGLQAVQSLNVRQYPRSDNASITIQTAYVGADADLVKGFVTVPLERAIAEADGIDYIESQSSLGLSKITARLKLNRDATDALAQVSSKVDQVRNDLPPEAEVPVINIESADSSFASLYLSFASEKLERNQITDYLIRSVQPRLAAVDGVQRAEILGARTFAMRIWLDPDKMAALNLSPSQVRAALAENNFLAAVGRTKGALIQVNLTANTNLSSVEDFERLVIRQEGGAIVRLQDIGRVVLGAEDYDSEVRFSGQTAVFMGIYSLPNANALEVIRRVRQEVDALQADLPPALEASTSYDATRYIEDAIGEVVGTLMETLLIVVIVIFLFLGSLRSVLVPLVAIPISLIGAVFLMQIFGFTVNLLTLLAIVLSVGLVVDDAIVMVENVERHLGEGYSPLAAAKLGARELAGPVVSMTVTLAAVYTPIGFQSGLTGALFREFAFTLAGAVLISGVVALTLSPIMSARLLRKGQNERGLPARISRGFSALRHLYGRLLDLTLESRPAVYVSWIGLSILGVVMFSMSARELAPVEDQGVIFGIVETPSNSTLEQVSLFANKANDAFMSAPETNHTFQVTFPDRGFLGMVTAPWSERERSVFDILPSMRQELAAIPGIRAFPVAPAALPGGGRFPVEFVLASTTNTEQVFDLAQQLQQKATMSGMFAFPPIIDVKFDQPQTEFIIDRDKVAQLGLSLADVGGDLAGAVGGNFVNRFDVDGRSYKVIPQVARMERMTPEQLQELYVTGPDGRLVTLGSVATLRDEVQPRSLHRFQQLNAVKISGVSTQPLDVALRFLEDEAAKIMPPGYVIDYTGESRQLRAEGDSFLASFSLAVVLIFLVLAAQFNSFRDPLVILLGSVPLAMFGALIFTFLKMPNPEMKFWTDGWTTTLNVYSQVGLVTLVGLVAKNGILIVEFANKLQTEGYSKLEAIRRAGRIRLRPVLMTTVATVLGHLPLTLVTGPGAEARNSIGLVLVGGMTIGTLFTLFFVPSIYLLIARDHSRDQVRETSTPRAPVPVGA